MNDNKDSYDNIGCNSNGNKYDDNDRYNFHYDNNIS